MTPAVVSEAVPDLRLTLQRAVGATYVVERELGAGGMARVFLATDAADGREVAIKVLSPAVSSCCDSERFRREMRVAASLVHPNIVPLLRECDVCGGERLFYFVMPYIDGESLRARLDRDGALPVATAVRVLRDVASALAHAHAAGVVHRDIKPENVLLSHGRALVTDFGVAKALWAGRHDPETTPSRGRAFGALPVVAGLTVAGDMVGTPAYAAPEQALGDASSDHRADLYSLGVIAYEMLAGTPPFAGRGALAQIAAHVTEPPPPLNDRVTIAPQLQMLVARLLAKLPDERPGSASQVLEMLERLG